MGLRLEDEATGIEGGANQLPGFDEEIDQRDEQDDAEAEADPVIDVREDGEVGGRAGRDEIGFHGDEIGGDGDAEELGDEIEGSLRAVVVGIERDDLGDELEGEEDEEQDVERLPGRRERHRKCA